LINKDLIIIVGGITLRMEMSGYYSRWDVFGILCWSWWNSFIL